MSPGGKIVPVWSYHPTVPQRCKALLPSVAVLWLPRHRMWCMTTSILNQLVTCSPKHSYGTHRIIQNSRPYFSSASHHLHCSVIDCTLALLSLNRSLFIHPSLGYFTKILHCTDIGMPDFVCFLFHCCCYMFMVVIWLQTSHVDSAHSAIQGKI